MLRVSDKKKIEVVESVILGDIPLKEYRVKVLYSCPLDSAVQQSNILVSSSF